MNYSNLLTCGLKVIFHLQKAQARNDIIIAHIIHHIQVIFVKPQKLNKQTNTLYTLSLSLWSISPSVQNPKFGKVYTVLKKGEIKSPKNIHQVNGAIRLISYYSMLTYPARRLSDSVESLSPTTVYLSTPPLEKKNKIFPSTEAEVISFFTPPPLLPRGFYSIVLQNPPPLLSVSVAANTLLDDDSSNKTEVESTSNGSATEIASASLQ